MGLAMKRAGPANIEVAGTAARTRLVSQAQKLGAVDVKRALPAEEAVSARMVIVGTPVMTAKRCSRRSRGAGPGTMVTDTGSTKGEVMRWANGCCPRPLDYVGGHPMAGKETRACRRGPGICSDGRSWVIVPSR